MIRRLVVARLVATAATTALLTTSVLAQQPPAPSRPQAPFPPAGPPPKPPTPPQPPRPPAPPQPEREGQLINVRIEVTLTEQRPGGKPVRKTVSLVTRDGRRGALRSQTFFAGLGQVPLNVDALPSILPTGQITVEFGVQYDLPSQAAAPPPADPARQEMKTEIRQNMAVILTDGQPLAVSQSADPTSDRQVTIEVRAVVLK